MVSIKGLVRRSAGTVEAVQPTRIDFAPGRRLYGFSRPQEIDAWKPAVGAAVVVESAVFLPAQALIGSGQPWLQVLGTFLHGLPPLVAAVRVGDRFAGHTPLSPVAGNGKFVELTKRMDQITADLEVLERAADPRREGLIARRNAVTLERMTHGIELLEGELSRHLELLQTGVKPTRTKRKWTATQEQDAGLRALEQRIGEYISWCETFEKEAAALLNTPLHADARIQLERLKGTKPSSTSPTGRSESGAPEAPPPGLTSMFAGQATEVGRLRDMLLF
jgi:hypothetical protein